MALAMARMRDMLELTRSAVCPAEYATTDRICQRWDVSVGDGQQSDKWQDGGKSRPPPLDDDTAIIVDQIIIRSPKRTNLLIRKWYRTDLPDTVIAQQLGLTPRTLIPGWHICLNYLRWKFSESGHKPLLAILKWRE